MKLINKYNSATQALYDHVGFEEGWQVFPIDDSTRYWWRVNLFEDQVEFYNSKKAAEMEDENHSYSNEIMTNIHFPKSIFRGKTYTLIIVDTHTDGNKFFQIFLNSKELKPKDE